MSKKTSLILLLIVSFVFISFFYGKVLLHPNSYLFSSKGDGIKNYFTFTSHIHNDLSIVELQGMNYPYGENFLYTDCQPLLTVLFKSLSGVFPNIGNYSIGFINLMMIFSFLITAVLLFMIFGKLKVDPLMALISAFGITVLSPQIFRIMGHLALSYSFFIPLTWYLMIKYFESPKKIKWTIILFVNNICWFYIHAYLGMITVSFVFFLWFIDFLYKIKSSYRQIQVYLSCLIFVVLPVILFQLIIHVTDAHIGRTTSPSGFFLYNSELDDIFVPSHPPLRILLDKIVLIKQNWEGWSYVGLTSIAATLIFLVLTIKNAIKSKHLTFNNRYFNDYHLKIALLASIILLLYAFGMPFKQFRILLEWFSPLKSFRATGRFAWVFYFVVTVAAIYFFNNIIESLKEKKKTFSAWLLIILLPSLFIIEGWTYHQEASREIVKSVNLFDSKQLNATYTKAISKINPEDFQAIIPLPFYYNGSDNFTRPVQNDILTYSMVVSYHTSLPICAAYLTRIAIPESKKIVQVISPDYYDKPLLKDLKNNKPFLVVRSNEQLSEYEQEIINKSTLIYNSAGMKLYKLCAADLFKNNANAEIDSFKINKNKLFSRSGFLVSDTVNFLYYNSFEDSLSDHIFRGKGGLSFKKTGKYTIVNFPANTFKKDQEYMVSAWMYNALAFSLSGWFRFIVEEYNVAENKWTSTWCLPTNSEVIHGDWSLVELKFKVTNPQNNISIITIGSIFEKEKVYLDDLLIREVNTDVYKIIKQDNNINIRELFKNNQQVIVK